MSEEKTRVRGAHPTAGMTLGIIGMAAALALCLPFGVMGGAVALALGLLALCLGIRARDRSGKGITAIVTGIVAVALAITLTVTAVTAVTALHHYAVTASAPLAARYTGAPALGLTGLLVETRGEGADMAQLSEEIRFILKMLDGTVPSTAAWQP